MLMVRRGRYKFIHSPGDPDQLFDLADDPGETVNYADDPRFTGVAAALREEMYGRWDVTGLHQAVLESQRRRRLIDSALRQGRRPGWDWQPPRDASREYIRTYMELDDLERNARLPRAG
jgi:choline-sulfatase